jgi:hypothetical protein
MEGRILHFLWRDSLAAWWTCSSRRSTGDVHQRGGADQSGDCFSRHHKTSTPLIECWINGHVVGQFPRFFSSPQRSCQLLHDDDRGSSNFRTFEQRPFHCLWIVGSHLSGVFSSHGLTSGKFAQALPNSNRTTRRSLRSFLLVRLTFERVQLWQRI